MKSTFRLIPLALLLACFSAAHAQSVFIVVIDGVRYSEAYDLKDRYLPRKYLTA